MNRQPITKTLLDYRSAYPSESAEVDRILALVESRPNCFDRDCRPGHLTGSAWVVSSDGERHLLLLHRKLGKWLQPGGHADGDPDIANVALREAQEETGLGALELVTGPYGLAPLDVDVHDIPARYDSEGGLVDDAHEHHDVRFLFRVRGEDSLTISDESDDLRWCLPEEVRRLTQEESVLRLLDKAELRLANRLN